MVLQDRMGGGTGDSPTFVCSIVPYHVMLTLRLTRNAVQKHLDDVIKVRHHACRKLVKVVHLGPGHVNRIRLAILSQASATIHSGSNSTFEKALFHCEAAHFCKTVNRCSEEAVLRMLHNHFHTLPLR